MTSIMPMVALVRSDDEPDFVQGSPVSTCCHPAGGLLVLRFTLRLRDVQEMRAWRGIDVTYETIRVRVNKFGPLIAANLRRRRQDASRRWHLDEMVCLSRASDGICGMPSTVTALSWVS